MACAPSAPRNSGLVQIGQMWRQLNACFALVAPKSRQSATYNLSPLGRAAYRCCVCYHSVCSLSGRSAEWRDTLRERLLNIGKAIALVFLIPLLAIGASYAVTAEYVKSHRDSVLLSAWRQGYNLDERRIKPYRWMCSDQQLRS